MKKEKIFSTRYGGRAFDAFCNAMYDKIKEIKNEKSIDGTHIAWRVIYEDEDEKEEKK